MSDLKPLGSEKLSGQDKIQRIMEIARYKENAPSKDKDLSKSEYGVDLADGNNYQIVKERQGYIIKKTISESEADYIEPMKNRKYYSSYSQAFKRLNLLAKEINRLNENEDGVSLFGEQKKFVLKTPKPSPEVSDELPPAAPPAVPQPELPPSPNDELSDMGTETSDEMGVGNEPMEPEVTVDDETVDLDQEVDINAEKVSKDTEEDVTFKTIQKLTGKLTQKIRTLDNKEGMTSEDIKYVINMVLSSLDLSALSDEDKEDIMSKFEDVEEESGSDDMGGADMTDDTEVEDIQAQMDVEPEVEESSHGAILDSIFNESKVDKVLSKYFEISKKEILESKRKIQEKNLRKKLQFESKLTSVQKMSETYEQELASKKFLEENKDFQFIGKTNLKNLIFENKETQIKITPDGLVS